MHECCSTRQRLRYTFGMFESRMLRLLVVLCAALLVPTAGRADYPKSISCPAGRIYVERDNGRDQFCQLQLPGSLWVQDGPARWWFSEGHLGEEGSYRLGRKVGRWKECNRFDHCRVRTYPALWPQEQQRKVRNEIPVTYAGGKYVFDFGSCRSAWVTRQTPDSYVELNIGTGLLRCQVTYIPSTAADRPTGRGPSYFCEVPYSVGVRQFASIDLRKELPRAGLPQFCRKDEPGNVPQPDGPEAAAFSLSVNLPFIDANNKEAKGFTTLANIVDVVCASLKPRPAGPDELTVRFNDYVEKLVIKHAKDEVKANACGMRTDLTTVGTSRDASGHTLFTYRFSPTRAVAARQRACIASQAQLQPSCASR